MYQKSSGYRKGGRGEKQWFRCGQGFWPLLCAFLVFGGITEARIRYVKPGGNDGSDGLSVATAWKTIGKANGSLVAGDTVYILGGTYVEKIDPANAGAPGKEIAYIGYQNDRVTIGRSASPADEVQAYLGQPYIRLQSLDILPSNYATYRVQQWVSTRYMIVVNGNYCTLNHVRIPGGIRAGEFATITDNLLRGVNVAGQHVTLEHCYVRGTDIGVVVSGDAPRYFKMHEDTVSTAMWSLVQIGTPETHVAQRNLIEYCILDSSWAEDGIQFESTLDTVNIGTWIRYCRISNCGENLIDLKGAKDIVIEYTILYSSGGDDNGPYQNLHASWDSDRTGSAWTWGIPTAANAHAIGRFNLLINNAGGIDSYVGDYIYNNTIMNNRHFWNGSTYSSNQDAKLYAFQTFENRPSAAVNNIMVGQAGAGHNGILYGDFRYTDRFRLDNNLYWEDAGQQDAPIFRDRHGSSPNFSDDSVHGLVNWRRHISGYALLGKDAHSVQADPQLHVGNYPTDYSSSMDFTADTQSPTIDAGTYLALTSGGGANSTALVVDNPGAFSDGIGIPGVLGDSISVGGEKVRIQSISGSTLQLSRPISWSSGSEVYYWPFKGSGPNIGAFESQWAAPGAGSPPPALVNVLANPTFESGTDPWVTYSNGVASFTTGPGFESSKAAKIAITQGGTNEQMFQSNRHLEPNARYRLTFDAYSNTGHSLEVSLMEHVDPFAGYGVSGVRFDLGTSWKSFSIEFTTPDLAAPVDDARLQFWLVPYAAAGDEYYIDNVVLAELDGTTSALAQQVVPAEYRLDQNFPNPFNPSTLIRYALSTTSRVTLKIFDVIGREVATLVDELQQAGGHDVRF